MKLLNAGVAVGAALLCAVPAFAGNLYVICNPGVTVGAADVRGVFTGDKQFAGGVKLFPTDNKALQQAFLDKVLQMDEPKYTALWTKKSFRDGTDPPPSKASDAEVIDYIKRTAGACGYVATTPPAGLTVVGQF